VSTFALAALLNFSLLTGAPATYADAYQQATTGEGRPLVVLVGADWCPACQMMKQSIMPQLQQRGSLDKVAFATVNTDRDSAIASQLMEGGTIPQLIMYVKTDQGWTRRQLTGGQSVEGVEGFLASGVKAPTGHLTSREVHGPAAN
jgi:thiol-disulfide isomerase/thioredoxin